MIDDNSDALNWEKSICDLVAEAIEQPHSEYEICEQIIEIVEDLIFTAYVKGRLNAPRQK